MLGRYLAAAGLVRLADEGARVSLILLALERTGSVAVGGILLAVLLIPHVLAAPGIGWLVDRSSRPQRRLTLLILVFAASLVASVVLLGRVPLWVTVAVLLVGGCCGPAITGGLTSQIPGLVGDQKTARAFGLDSLVYNLAGIGGPLLAATLAAVSGPASAQLALAVSALVGAVGVLTWPSPQRAPRPGIRPDLLEGLRQTWRSRPLRVVTIASAVGQLGPGAMPVAAVAFAATLHRPADAGLLLAAVGAGALLGSLVCIWKPIDPGRAASIACVSMIGIGLPLALAGLAPGLGVALLIFAVSGIFVGPYAAALFGTRHRYADAAVRTQVFTVGAGLKITAAAAGAGLASTITTWPAAAQLAAAGSFPVLAGIVATTALMIKRGPRRSKTADLVITETAIN